MAFEGILTLRMKKKRATQDDVAALAGVTRATVSYVLTGRAESLKITQEVIDRVKEAAEKLDYLPNLAARSLAAGQSRQIGVVIFEPGMVRNLYWSPILSGIEKAALEADYDVLIVQGKDVARTARNYLLQNRVDAVIFLGGTFGGQLLEFPVPPVFAAASSFEHRFPSVVNVMNEAMRDVARELAKAGVDSVHWIGPPRELLVSSGSQDRPDFLEEHCRSVGLPFVAHELRREKFGHASPSLEIASWGAAIRNYGLEFRANSGYVCWNDMLALGLYGALRDAGLEPGRGAAVVGIDNQISEVALPPLASVGFNSARLGEVSVAEAIRCLRDYAEDEPPERFEPVEVPARLFVRESLGLSSL